MSAETDLAAARAKADEAKRKLMQSTHTLQARVAPKRLANDALETAKERGIAALDGAKRTARRKPAVIAAAAIGLVAFLARRPLLRLVRRRREPDRITIRTAGKRALSGPKGDKK